MRRYWAVVALLVAAVLVVALAITYGLANLGRSPQTGPGPEPVADAPPAPEIVSLETKPMLVAARYLAVGALLGEADVVSEPLEAGRIPSGAIPESDAEDILGTAVRVPIDAGTPVLFTDLVHPGARGFLSLILSPGMRAVSVRIEPETRFAGLVDPGDRVDVIFTASAPPTDHLLLLDVDSSGEGPLSRVLFEDLRVLAIDRTVRPPAVGGEAPVEERSEFTVATLEVSPAQAPVLVHANRQGQIALAIRAAQAAPDPASSVSAGVHIEDLFYPDARPKPPHEIDPVAAEVFDEPTKGVSIFRAHTRTEEWKEFPDIGPPWTTWTLTRIPSPPVPAPSPPALAPSPPVPAPSPPEPSRPPEDPQ